MNKLQGKIDLLFDRDRGCTIRVKDEKSCINILEVQVKSEDVAALMSSLGHVDCEFSCVDPEIYGRVGKKMIMDTLEFPMPECKYSEEDQVVRQEALKLCPDGWVPDLHFGSKYSFFFRNGVEYARCTIRSWVEED